MRKTKKVNHDRITFNGHDLSSLLMCRMGRPIMPPVEVKTVTVGGRHGELFRDRRLQGYTIPVEVWLRTEDRRDVAEIRHKLAALLWTDEPAPLCLPDDPTRYHLAIVSGATDLEAIVDGVPGTTINFYVPDPIAYGNPRKESLATGANKTIDAGGTWPAKPVIKSTAAGDTWRITNVTTGEYVEITASSVGASIPSGAVIVCDMALERFTLNGNDVAVTAPSDFFEIADRCTIKVTGGNNTTVEWEERWL